MACLAIQSALLVIDASSNCLLHVCRLLNEEQAEYLVIGAWAMILNRVIRATEDVDILAVDHRENFQKVIAALSRLADAAAAELTPEDFIENVVIKVADEDCQAPEEDREVAGVHGGRRAEKAKAEKRKPAATHLTK